MPSKSPAQHRNIGDSAAPCHLCGGPRIWKHAKADGKSWRQYCSKCHSSNSAAARKKRIVAYNAQIAERRRTEPMFRAYEVWNGAKWRAKGRGIEFSLSRERVEKAILSGVCEVTGLPFDLRLKGKRLGALSPSIDRIDQRLGYTEENSQVVCWLYNRAKGDGTHSDVLMLVEALGAIGFRKAA